MSLTELLERFVTAYEVFVQTSRTHAAFLQGAHEATTKANEQTNLALMRVAEAQERSANIHQRAFAGAKASLCTRCGGSRIDPEHEGECGLCCSTSRPMPANDPYSPAG